LCGSAGVIWALAVTCAWTWFAEDGGPDHRSAGEMGVQAGPDICRLSECSTFFTIKQSPTVEPGVPLSDCSVLPFVKSCKRLAGVAFDPCGAGTILRRSQGSVHFYLCRYTHTEGC